MYSSNAWVLIPVVANATADYIAASSKVKAYKR